jgi:hypothetical protein
LCRIEDLLDCGFSEKSAKVLMKLIKKEKRYWQVVFAAQREYNWYLRSLGHEVQTLFKYSLPMIKKRDGDNDDSLLSSSIYTESRNTVSNADDQTSSIINSEVMSELNHLLDDN